MTLDNVLDQIENNHNTAQSNSEVIREKMIRPKLVQLHPNIEGFDSPENYGVYRQDGGSPLGVVGNKYTPVDMDRLLDAILGLEDVLDLSTLKYVERKGGSKVAFTIALPNKDIIGSPLVGDIVERRLEFRTGFDGLTKLSMAEFFNRAWCANGCSSPHELAIFSKKHTISNASSLEIAASKVRQVIQSGDAFIERVGSFSKIDVTKEEVNAYIKNVTGYDLKEYNEYSTRVRKTIDVIGASIAIESQNTGMNLFSLYNGLTRYTTHHKASGDQEKIIYSTVASTNNKAFKFASDMAR